MSADYSPDANAEAKTHEGRTSPAGQNAGDLATGGRSSRALAFHWITRRNKASGRTSGEARRDLGQSADEHLSMRDLFDRIIRQLSPGDSFVGVNGVAAAVSPLRQIAGKVPAAPREDLLKAVAVLLDRS
jgi:hypothetical protein